MKDFIKLFSVILAVLFILTGCTSILQSDGDIDDTSKSDSSDEVSETNSETESESETETEIKDVYYKIIYPEGCEKFINSLAVDIRDDINKKTDHKVVIESDTVKAGEYEILIGNTNRSESTLSSGSVGNAGWWISTTGTRITINAKSRQGLMSAAEYFLENYVVEDNGMVSISEDKCKTQYEHELLFTKGITLRVGTYIIKHGEMVGLDMSVIANDIKALDNLFWNML